MSAAPDPNEWLDDAVRLHPQSVFLRTPQGRELNYAELRAATARYAAVLSARGAAPGERVAVQVDKSVEAVLLYLACLRLGAVFVPINVANTASEVEYFLTDSQPRVAVVRPADLTLLEPLARRAGVLHVETLGAGGEGSLPELANRWAAGEGSLPELANRWAAARDGSQQQPLGESPAIGGMSSPLNAEAPATGGAPSHLNAESPVAGSVSRAFNPHAPAMGAVSPGLHAASPAALVYTSGTTGRSKGAVLTRGNLASNAAVLAAAWRFTPDDVLLHTLPLYHVHGLFAAINTVLASGSGLVLMPKFDAVSVLGWLPKVSVYMGVPTHYTRLLQEPALDARAAARMRLFVSGSAPLLAETHREFLRRTGHTILERYGMTETLMITSNPYDGPRLPGSVGPALPGVSVRVQAAAGQQIDERQVEASGEAAVARDIGEIHVKGPNVFAGYWRDAEKTRAAFTADRWFKTGDLGRIDAQGYVSIVGRAKDLVISGGYNVYPKDVETALDAVAGVRESAVFGVPHPDLGEGVTAAVVLLPDGTSSEAEVIRAVRARLAGYKIPKRIIFLDELPRNAMGKVQKAALRAAYAALYGGGRVAPGTDSFSPSSEVGAVGVGVGAGAAVGVGAGVAVGVGAGVGGGAGSRPAPLKLLSSMAAREVLAELVARYRGETARWVEADAAGGVDVVKRVASGEAVDVVVLAANSIDKLIADAKLLAGSRVDLVRSGIAVAVRAGAGRPDVDSEEGLRRAVVAARSVSYSTGPSGVYLEKVFERWGILEDIRGRIVVPAPGVPVASLVASGVAEIGFQQASELMNVAGIEVVGPLPAGIQSITTFSGAIGAACKDPEAARELLRFMASPGVSQIKRRHGMEPA